jgi:hypothetical protein
MFRRIATAGLLSLALIGNAAAGEGKTHRIAIQVDQNDPQVMNMALNNAGNVIDYYRARNEDVDVEIVAYGPGLNMLRLAGYGPDQAAQGHGLPRQDPVLRLQ